MLLFDTVEGLELELQLLADTHRDQHWPGGSLGKVLSGGNIKESLLIILKLFCQYLFVQQQ